MLSPFKHVGGILSVFSRAFSLPLTIFFFFFFMAIARQADEARRLNRSLKVMLLLHCCEAERRFRKMPVDIDSEGEGEASYVRKRE